MAFNELIASMREPGEDGVSDTIYDDLTTEYQTAIDGGAASIAERDLAITERDAEIARLKGINFDLLMAAGVSDESGTDEIENEPEPDPEIDDLFDRK